MTQDKAIKYTEHLLNIYKFENYPALPNRDFPSHAILVPLENFQWQKEPCGVVIDFGATGDTQVIITGYLPKSASSDLSERDMKEWANAYNTARPGVQVFGDEGRFHARTTFDSAESLTEDDYRAILTNAFYDVVETLDAFRRHAKHRGNFPSDGYNPGYEEMPT